MKARVIAAAMMTTIAMATALTAADLGKYTDWPTSPQAYFMTKAERAGWSRLTGEADAERFIDHFIAARGRRFADEVAAAAKAADEHLSVGGKLGSRTLRGKIVILLGPPAKFAVSPVI